MVLKYFQCFRCFGSAVCKPSFVDFFVNGYLRIFMEKNDYSDILQNIQLFSIILFIPEGLFWERKKRISAIILRIFRFYRSSLYNRFRESVPFGL